MAIGFVAFRVGGGIFGDFVWRMREPVRWM